MPDARDSAMGALSPARTRPIAPPTTTLPLAGPPPAPAPAPAAPPAGTDPGPEPPPAPGRRPRRRRSAVVVAGLVAVAVTAAVVALALRGGPSSAAPDPQASPAALAGGSVPFGGTFTYDDGLAVTVGAPEAFAPSPSAETTGTGTPVRVEVRVDNGTTEPFQPATLATVATADGGPAATVWDPELGLELTGPPHAAPAGATTTFQLAWTVVDPQSLRLEITPALVGYEPLVVTG